MLNNSRARSYQNVSLSPMADFNKRCEEFTSSGGILHAYQQPDDEPTVLKEYKMLAFVLQVFIKWHRGVLVCHGFVFA